MSGVRHLYVHLPFCAHRCGYCDFVTAVGRRDQHARYVEALLGELELERHRLAPHLETVFLGGGTPTYTEPRALAHLLGALPSAPEVTVEANPETVTPELAALLAEGSVTRVSLGVQSFAPHLLRTLERRANPNDVRRAVYALRVAGFDNISIDLIYGIPGQSPADLDRDLAEGLALGPEHLSCYELEAKPGTRFTFAHGRALALQADAMEGYFEQVVDSLQGAGYRWYETSNFCRPAERDASRRDLRSRHNLAYWLGRDYVGLGMGAVSTVRGSRWRNTPRLSSYLAAASLGRLPDRELERLDEPVRLRERLLLGLRLDEPLDVSQLVSAIDRPALERLEKLGLAERAGTDASHLRLTRRGRFLGGGVTADLLS